MAKHVSQTPATQLLKAHQVVFTEHPYEYLEHGGALHSAVGDARGGGTPTAATVVAQTDTAGAYGKFSIGTNGAWTYTTNDAANQLKEFLTERRRESEELSRRIARIESDLERSRESGGQLKILSIVVAVLGFIVTTALWRAVQQAQKVNATLEQTIGAVESSGKSSLDGIMTLVPEAIVAHVGIRRDEETALPQAYYANLPDSLATADIFLLDPMLATGGSACEAIRQLKEAGALTITMLCVVSCPEGLAALEPAHPDVPVVTAAVDAGLNEKCYIVPGLGDAGDRYFGT